MQANTLLKKLVMDKRGTGSNPTIATECRQERTGPEVWEALHDKTWRRPGEPWMHDDAGADRTWGTSDKFRPRMFVPDAFTGPSSTQQEQRWVHGNLTMPQFHEKMAGTARQLATDSQNILPDTSSEERLAFFRNEVKGALGFVSNEKNLMQALTICGAQCRKSWIKINSRNSFPRIAIERFADAAGPSLLTENIAESVATSVQAAAATTYRRCPKRALIPSLFL